MQEGTQVWSVDLYLSPLTFLSLSLRDYRLLLQAVVDMQLISWSESF